MTASSAWLPSPRLRGGSLWLALVASSVSSLSDHAHRIDSSLGTGRGVRGDPPGNELHPRTAPHCIRPRVTVGIVERSRPSDV
jgi:hypothetical protein